MSNFTTNIYTLKPRYLNRGIPGKAQKSYLSLVKSMVPKNPVLHIDDNKMFLKLDDLKQDYVIRLTAKRKLFFTGNGSPQHSLETNAKERSKHPLSTSLLSMF